MTAGFSGTDKCASCIDFPLRESVDTAGHALCKWWGDRFYLDGACVLHNPATDRRERAQIVRRLAELKKTKGEKID